MLSGLLLGLLVSCSSKQESADYGVIPLPQEITLGNSTPFILSDGVKILYPAGNASMEKNADFLAEYIKESTGKNLVVEAGTAGDNAIVLSLGMKSDKSEAYQLKVTSKGVSITAPTEAGVFYGVQTLRKSLPIVKDVEIVLPEVVINDVPRFEYRGMMLDVSRHFFSVDSIKRYIDLLALHNMNRFHWHLTDDQGWRIEIKQYPELTESGSKRKETVIGKNSGKYDGKPYGGFYTQEDAKEIVAYAKDRFITVIPEIDLPGHMLGALSVYPELGCTGGPYETWTQWGVSDDVLCAGNAKSLEFVKDVLGELLTIFPSEYIHIGGDECPKTRWAKCKKCQAKIKALRLKGDKSHSKEERLQSYFITSVSEFLAENNRKMIGWDEILEGGLAPNATVMAWRGVNNGLQAVALKHNVIMTPTSHLYFDYYQSINEQEPLAIGGYLPLEKVYSFDPIPDHLSKEDKKFIVGVQANIWTEYMPSFSHVEYMLLPRMDALAEVQWTEPTNKNYDNFLTRMPKMFALYNLYGYNYGKHLFDITTSFVPNSKNKTLDVTLSTLDGADIYYTLDGTEPTASSPKYTKPVMVNESCTFKSMAIRPIGNSVVFSEKINLNKASLKPITMLQPVNKQYEFGGAPTLVDGLRGTANYKTGRWIAFYRNDMEAVLDLQQSTEISSAEIVTCVEKGDWVFDARGFAIEVSEDGKTYTSVASEEYPAMTNEDRNGLFTHTLKFDAVKTRYVKVIVKSEQSIPSWHGGKGKPGFLFIDEIILN